VWWVVWCCASFEGTLIAFRVGAVLDRSHSTLRAQASHEIACNSAFAVCSEMRAPRLMLALQQHEFEATEAAEWRPQGATASKQQTKVVITKAHHLAASSLLSDSFPGLDWDTVKRVCDTRGYLPGLSVLRSMANNHHTTSIGITQGLTLSDWPPLVITRDWELIRPRSLSMDSDVWVVVDDAQANTAAADSDDWQLVSPSSAATTAPADETDVCKTPASAAAEAPAVVAEAAPAAAAKPFSWCDMVRKITPDDTAALSRQVQHVPPARLLRQRRRTDDDQNYDDGTQAGAVAEVCCDPQLMAVVEKGAVQRLRDVAPLRMRPNQVYARDKRIASTEVSRARNLANGSSRSSKKK
jgi:hypothetical protein